MSRTIYFDLDGVLVDSRPGIVACVNRVLTEAGFEREPESGVARIIGPPLKVGFAMLLAERANTDQRLVDRCVRRYRELYSDALVGAGTVLQAGIGEMLESLRGRIALAVATSKPVRFAEAILHELGIRDAFLSVTGPTPATDGESKTSTLRRALAGLPGSDPAESWMVGDRWHDMVAADENGVVSIGTTWGFGSEAELRAAGAKFIVREPGDLTALFEAENLLT